MKSEYASDLDNGGFIVSCRDCNYSRNFGGDRGAASRAGTRHANRKPTHRVRLLKIIHEWSAIESMHQLGSEPPPW